MKDEEEVGEDKFNIGDYVIQFKSVLIVPEISSAFYSFLKEEFSTDNWDFILSLQTLEKLTQKKNQAKVNTQVLHLLSTFIEPKSKKELEICLEEKKLVLQKTQNLSLKEWNLDVSPLSLFEPFRTAILNEYKNDSFKRFIRTPNCLELLEKHSNNRDVLLPRLALVYNYTEEDFDREFMDKNDLNFMAHYEMDNPNWILISSMENTKKKNSVYFSPWNYFPNVKFLGRSCFNIKTHMEFNVGFEEVILSCFKNMATNTSASYEILEYKFGEQCILQLEVQTFKLFMNNRYVKLIYQMSYDPEQRSVTLKTKSSRFQGSDWFCNGDLKLKSKKGNQIVKAMQCFCFGSMKVTEIKENKVIVEYISTVDIGGYKPSKTLLKYVRNFFLQIFKIGNQNQNIIYKNNERLGDRKTLLDNKYELNELWEGLPKDPVGKLLWDLDIAGQDKQYKEKMEKRKKVFDISKYVIHFSSLKRKEISQAYYQFLKEEHNSDSWDFILECSNLKKLNEKGKSKQESEKVTEIVNTFIEQNSPKDLCIGEERIKELKQNLDKKLKNYPTFKYFHKIYQDLKLEHQLDSFKRFVKIPSMNDIFAKYQHDIEVMSPILGVLSTYESIDFSSKKFTSKDFEFISSVVTNSWTWFELIFLKIKGIPFTPQIP
jgi:hypothetical protein